MWILPGSMPSRRHCRECVRTPSHVTLHRAYFIHSPKPGVLDRNARGAPLQQGEAPRQWRPHGAGNRCELALCVHIMSNQRKHSRPLQLIMYIGSALLASVYSTSSNDDEFAPRGRLPSAILPTYISTKATACLFCWPRLSVITPERGSMENL